MASIEPFAALRTKPQHLARELEPRERLPYARHLTERIVRLDNGALMMSFRLDGASFETADVRDLNDWHGKLNGAWRNLAYIDGFGLTEREFHLVREDLATERRQFLVKQGLNSVVVELHLDGLSDQLAILSGRTETVELLDRLRTQHGDAYADWALPFQQQRRGLS